MWMTAMELCKSVMGCKLAYTQSDEITLLVTDDDTIETQAWFGKNLQKIVSVAASTATYWFNHFAMRTGDTEPLKIAAMTKVATFDARAFLLPREEVLNCFEWRQQDCTRNAIESLGQAHFSHTQLLGKSCNEIQEMLWNEKQINFNDCPIWFKRGVCVVKESYEITGENGEALMRRGWIVDDGIPIFHKEPEYIDRFVYHREET